MTNAMGIPDEHMLAVLRARIHQYKMLVTAAENRIKAEEKALEGYHRGIYNAELSIREIQQHEVKQLK